MVFKGVVGQDLKMIQVGDYIKLAFDHYEVIWLCMFYLHSSYL